MRLTVRGIVAAGALLGCAGQALAQVPPRTRGTITAINGNDATIRTSDGTVTAHLASDTGVIGAKTASLADIKPNSFIGTAAVPGPGGTLRALEVTIFPESMRGAGEGNYPWDLGAGGSMTNGAVSSMTNGTVHAASSMTNGTVGAMTGGPRTIKVSYKGGEQTVRLPHSIPVVMLEPGDRSMLKPGARVVVFGPKENGGVDAKRIVVGEDGARPPM